MGIGADRMFVEQIGARVDGFAWIKPDVANCRCEICGDSSTDLTKRRGYWLPNGDGYTYYCHKGGEDCTRSLRRYIEEFHNDIYPDYVKESYLERGSSTKKRTPKPTKAPTTTTRRLGKGPIKLGTHPALEAMVRVDQLPDDHFCKKYVKSRAIPESAYKLLYYTDNFSASCHQINTDDPDLKLPEDQRLVIPMFDSRGALKAAQGRALDPKSERRYMTVKKDNDTSKTYGDERVDPSRVNLVTEGPLDSLFLPNSRATCDADLMTIVGENTIYVPDNQYREMAICVRIERWIAAGAKVVLFPPDVVYKDINDMCMPSRGNMSQRELLQLIADNVYSGLAAKLRFAKLKKC